MKVGGIILKRVDVASALIHDENGYILLVKNRKGDSFYWGLPGGAVEENETLEKAVIREVREETGYKIKITGLNSIREVLFSDRGHHALIITFNAKIIDGQININDPDNDIVEARWVDYGTAKELMPFLFESLRIDSNDNKSLAFYEFEGVR